MKIPEYIKGMDDKEFLEALDNYDERKGYYYIHEAARRIRQLKGIVRHPTSQCSRPGNARCICPDCGQPHDPKLINGRAGQLSDN